MKPCPTCGEQPRKFIVSYSGTGAYKSYGCCTNMAHADIASYKTAAKEWNTRHFMEKGLWKILYEEKLTGLAYFVRLQEGLCSK